MKQLQTPLISVLAETLASHRYALGLDQDNADTLFNTGQVLTSIAEEVSKNDSTPDSDAMAYLEEALELLQRCLTLQEYRYTHSQEEAADALQASKEVEEEEDRSMHDTVRLQDSLGAESEQEQWVSVIEPVTKDTLVDTIIAQLSTLTTLCGILGSSQGASRTPSLAWVEEYSSKLLNIHLPPLIQNTDRSIDIGVAKAVFVSALIEAGFRRNEIDVQTYRRERDVAFSELPISTSFTAIMANIASLFAFNHALSDTYPITSETADIPSLRWNALAAAISNLTTASRLTEIASEDLPKTHLLRGEASMYQYQLSKPPISYLSAPKNSAALLKNAEIFYRNASRLTQDEDERARSRFQEAIYVSLQGNMHVGRGQLRSIATNRSNQWMRDQIDELVADGLLSEDDLEKIEPSP